MNDSTSHHLLAYDASLGNAGTDPDPQETAEWRDAFEALVATQGAARARQMLEELSRVARARRIGWQPELCTPYLNTIAVNEQPVFPGDLAIEERLASLMRWNALAMVVRANQVESGGSSELGGHIASTPVQPTCLKPGSTISSGRERALLKGSTAATWCSSSRTVRRACTQGLTLKAG